MSRDRKSTRLNSSHMSISYAVFCLKKKKHQDREQLSGALPDRALVGAREEIELIRATDHRRLQVALDRKRLRTEGEQPMGLDRFRLALELQRLERLDLDRVTREPVGHVTDEDLPRL